MYVCDVNVLLYAFRPELPFHEECRAWIESALAGHESYGVSELVMSAVVRIATNPRALTPPESLEDIFTFVNVIRRDAKAIVLTPGPRHWEIFEGLCRESATRAGRVADAYLAALAIEHGAELVTTDGDFARFPALRWRRPF